MEQNLKEKRFSQVFGTALAIMAAGVMVTWLLNTPGGLLGKADAIAYAVCHRIDRRSFHLDGRQLPLCARCTGMFLGALLGLAYQAILGRGRSGMPVRKVAVVLGLFFLAFGADGLNSYLHFFPGAPSLYEPQNWLRLVTGTGMGLGIAAVLFPTFNQTVWAGYNGSPILGSWKVLGGLVVLAASLDLLVLSANPLILYPLALLSAASVILLLVMVYAIVWIMILRKENTYRFLGQLWLPLVGGFLIAMVQISAFDAVRFFFTHTWGGFLFG